MAIVIDGDFDVKDEVFDFLYSHKWDDRYSNVTFIPYKSNDVFTRDDQIRMMISNNIYQSNLARVILRVRNANVEHDLSDESTSFQDWLYHTTIGGKDLIKGVEVAPDDVVRILFEKDDADDVKQAIHNLYPHIVDTFGTTLAAEMVDENSLQRAKSSSDVEKQHSKLLKEKSGNPQGPDDISTYSQPQQQARGYYGTYLKVTQGSQTQTSELTNEQPDIQDMDLRSQVKTITAA